MKTIKTILSMILLNFVLTVSYADENVFEPSKLLGNVSKVLDEYVEHNEQLEASLEKYNSGDRFYSKGEVQENFSLRDPFNSSNNLGTSGQRLQGGNSNSGFLPRAGHTKIPQILLKGIIIGSEGKDDFLALLELKNNGVYMVREGDEISFDQANPGSALRIKSISRLSVLVEVGDLGNAFIIR